MFASELCLSFIGQPMSSAIENIDYLTNEVCLICNTQMKKFVAWTLVPNFIITRNFYEHAKRKDQIKMWVIV